MKLLVKARKMAANERANHPWKSMIDPENFSPFPKNPTIAKFFKEIGLVDELGSGVRNIYKYSEIYSGAEPTFIEGDVFKTSIPLIYEARGQARVQARGQVRVQARGQEDKTLEILEFCKIARARSEIQKLLGIKSRGHFIPEILDPLVKGGLLKMTITDKPTSPNQKYYSER